MNDFCVVSERNLAMLCSVHSTVTSATRTVGRAIDVKVLQWINRFRNGKLIIYVKIMVRSTTEFISFQQGVSTAPAFSAGLVVKLSCALRNDLHVNVQKSRNLSVYL